ncbi:DUF3168 domain-containing protein [Bacillus gobiensis]|uniref:DUF3168 domain-containing protein n=1 Tax=Bacillus gobiensis TaxID=1441095 RepID=UPI003D1E0E12
MKTALFELQKALFQRFTNDTALSSKVDGRIYDAVPENTPYPYVSIGEPTNNPFDTKSSLGENIILSVHCWSSYNGKKEAYEILNLILQSLSGPPLQIGGGFKLQDFRREQMNVIIDIDGKTKHGILELRFYINN